MIFEELQPKTTKAQFAQQKVERAIRLRDLYAELVKAADKRIRVAQDELISAIIEQETEGHKW